MELLNTCVHDINRYLWGVFFLIPLLCGTGIFYTIRLRFVHCALFVRGRFTFWEKGGSIRHEFLSGVGNGGCCTGWYRKCSRDRYRYCFRWTWRTFLVVVGSFFRDGHYFCRGCFSTDKLFSGWPLFLQRLF